MDTIQHNPARLYNCDETSITSVQHKHTKILGLKGKHQITSLQSTERGFLVTVITCMSPTGHFIPPLLVFPRKYMKPELMNGTPPGSIHVCHPSELIQSETFSQWFLHIIKHKNQQKRSCYLSTGQALFTHQEPGGHYFSSRGSCWHHLPPTSQQPQNTTLE
jgi:hypothetical protein